jgi:hypothetical protein
VRFFSATFLPAAMLRIALWAGQNVIYSRNVKYTQTMGFYGGGDIELRLYRYFGIQTGITSITEYAPYTPPGGEEQYAKLTLIQIPVLVRLNIQQMVEGVGWNLTVFGGFGINAAVASVSDAKSADPGRMSFIAGGEVGLGGRNIRLFGGYRWIGGMGSGSIIVNGRSYDYRQGSHRMYGGLRFYLPFRQ